jgi:voltage-gated potassium channel
MSGWRAGKKLDFLRLNELPLRHSVYSILENGWEAGPAGAAIEALLVAFILINTAAYVLQSVPDIWQRYRSTLTAIEVVSVAFFSAEFAVRLWTAPEHPHIAARGKIAGRFYFATRPLMLIDLLAIAPAYIGLVIPFIDLRILRLFRLFRLLKIGRYSPALAALAQVLVTERRALFGTALLLLCLVIFAGSTMHVIEGSARPRVFGTIPDSMWWAICTLTTAGCSNATPVSALGRAMAGLTLVMGLGVFALPVGIIANGFFSEIHRRDFVVTSGMLARVPLFRDVDACAMGRLMTLLRSQSVSAGGVISTGGAPAVAMHFLIAGQAEARLSSGISVFRPGDVFGEFVPGEDALRDATILALTSCRMLTLSSGDFARMLVEYPLLRERVEHAFKTRVAEPAEDPSVELSVLSQAGITVV